MMEPIVRIGTVPPVIIMIAPTVVAAIPIMVAVAVVAPIIVPVTAMAGVASVVVPIGVIPSGLMVIIGEENTRSREAMGEAYGPCQNEEANQERGILGFENAHRLVLRFILRDGVGLFKIKLII